MTTPGEGGEGDAAPETELKEGNEGEAALETEELEPVEGEEGEGEPDEEDFEFDGVKARVPKTFAEKVRAGALMHADYTKKRETDAADRRAFEEERDATRQIDDEHIRLRGQLAHAEDAISR